MEILIYLAGAILSFGRINAFYTQRAYLTHGTLAHDIYVIAFLSLLSWVGLAIGFVPYLWIESEKDRVLFNFNYKEIIR